MGWSCAPSKINGTAFSSNNLLGLTQFLAIETALESERRTDVGIRRVVVVGVAVVVDIADVRGVAVISRGLPPVAPTPKPANFY